MCVLSEKGKELKTIKPQMRKKVLQQLIADMNQLPSLNLRRGKQSTD